MSSTETRVTENDGIIVGWKLEERINGFGVELEKLRDIWLAVLIIPKMINPKWGRGSRARARL